MASLTFHIHSLLFCFGLVFWFGFLVWFGLIILLCLALGYDDDDDDDVNVQSMEEWVNFTMGSVKKGIIACFW